MTMANLSVLRMLLELSVLYFIMAAEGGVQNEGVEQLEIAADE
jgi:hypothetical protein